MLSCIRSCLRVVHLAIRYGLPFRSEAVELVANTAQLYLRNPILAGQLHSNDQCLHTNPGI